MLLRLHRIGWLKKIAILVVLAVTYCLMLSQNGISRMKRYLNQGEQVFINGNENPVVKMMKKVQLQSIKITQKPKIPPRPKLILLYTPIFGQHPWRDTPHSYNFTELDNTPCSVNNCRMTYDKSRIREADIVEFHARDLPSPNDLRKLRLEVSQKQIWVWFMHESPENTFYSRVDKYDGIFNWTQTYSTKSDIYVPYFSLKKIEKSKNQVTKNYAAGKDKIVLALNSHCDAPRVDFVRRLKKYIQVDFYGSCQKSVNPDLPVCARFDPNCQKRLNRYKFFLAIENSFCDGYITEKYYENALQRGIVPIVFGGADYNDKRIALPRSFINVRDYKNLKELADYLNYLNRNDTAYNEYFNWKKDYAVVLAHALCLICKKAWEPRSNKSQIIKISEFWNANTKCEDMKKVMYSYV